jgi:hypothetical protein
MTRLLQSTKVALINVIVFVVLFGLVFGSIELYFRLRGGTAEPGGNGIWQVFRPYVMFTTLPGPYLAWTNEFTGEQIPSTVTTNSLGFNDPHEFDYTKPYEKAANERVVLFTGGSVAWGLGASATDKTIAGRIQYYLNKSQNEIKYTVINMAMGSYIAYQQFLAMSLWGESFRPDWVVSMDGFNDAGAGCGFSQGVGNPMYFAAQQAYITAYLFATRRPVFYRGWLENQLIKHSAGYRAFTGKEYVPDTLTVDRTSDETMTARRAIIPTEMGAARGILAFYLKGERAMLSLFPQARFILSTQPTVNDFRGDFVDIYDSPMDSDAHRKAAAAREAAVEQYLSQYEHLPCGHDHAQVSFTYDFVIGAIQLERLADEARELGREVQYYNVGTEFSNDRDARMPYFIDPAHMGDKGMDVLGRFYAEKILAVDNRIR